MGLVTASAHAATPAAKAEEVAYRDPTPDPTGLAVGSGHCAGVLPREAPHVFTAPTRGTLKVAVTGFQGVWGLHLEDAKGNVLTDTDSTASDLVLSVKVKKAGAVVHVAPCNLGGTVDATITLTFKAA